MYLIVPSPPNGTGLLVSFDITYEIKNTDDNTNAVIIDILWALVFLFFIQINPVKSNIAVQPFNIAWKNGSELKSKAPGIKTIPQIFKDNERIGDYKNLVEHLKEEKISKDI